MIEPSPDFRGGDANWYMFNGHELVTTGKTAGPLQTAPVYPVVLAIVQVLIPGESSGRTPYTDAEMQTVRVIQAILGAALCWFAYALARRLFSARVWRAGRRDPGDQPGADSRSGQPDDGKRVYVFRVRRAGALRRRAAKPHAAACRRGG